MRNNTNILLSREKKVTGVVNQDLFLDRNIQMVYKGDFQLVKDSINNILGIHSVDEIRNLYHTTEYKSYGTLAVFEHMRDRIANQMIDYSKRIEDVMFHTFALKVSGYFISTLIESKLYRRVNKNIRDEQAFLTDISIQFQQQILKLSYRTLVLDINVNRENNALLGETKEAKYDYYNRILLDDSTYLFNFFNVYPGLLRNIANEIRKTKKTILELLNRFDKDKLEIEKFLNKESNDTSINRIFLGLGDSHSDGRKVAKLLLGEDILIYKPRSLNIDLLYQGIANYLNKQINSEKYNVISPNVISRKNYGWANYIKYEECSCEEDIKRFYTRMGVQIALLHVLNAVDFHSENIIANGSNPVLIDLESLFHIPYEKKENITNEDAFNKAEQQLFLSVRALGLLPFFFGDSKVDISGIGRKGKVKSFIKVPQIKNLNTDAMKIEREYLTTDDTSNHPKLDGNYVYAQDYIKEIKDGFVTSYRVIKEKSDEILELIRQFGDEIVVRFIPKPTAKYSSLLELSFHPRFQHNAIDREVFVAKIWEEAKYDESYLYLAKHEYRDLINNDIPYFKMNIYSSDLLTARNKVIKGYFKRTPFETVRQKITSLSQEDLDFQLKVIELSMFATQDERQEVLRKFIPKNPEEYNFDFQNQSSLISKAEELADYIYAQAYEGTIDGRTNYCWLNSTPLGVEEIQWSIAAMGDTLYDGLSGMAMTYLALWIATGKTKYLDIGETLLRDIVPRFSNVVIDEEAEGYISVGAFTGVSSIVYTLMNYYQFSKKNIYKEQALTVATLIPKLLQHDKEFDIIGGSAGAIAVLVRSYEVVKEDLFLKLAIQCREHITNNVVTVKPEEISWIGIAQKPLTGFSHGNAGIIFALSLLNKYEKNPEVTEIIRKGMKFENQSMIKQNWIDFRKPIKEASTSAWCHGAPGIAISRLTLRESTDFGISTQAQSDLEQAIHNLFYDGFGREHSLCHGDIGNAMILIEYGRETNQANYTRIGQNLLVESIKSAEREGYKCGVGKNVETPNLMVGLAGVVYGILFACDERIPNILSLKLGEKN
ncbi:type 2 lantipeptide synthetase LanM family protein [Paenibacillus albidus]|uniref:type 2 lanthipeptide synthetase LanM family protein n=1 Tax=Paenibacillus albidus TaxID=2041023 RepID=UPI001BE7F193|nr:type 2 lanthipeptide synthetase LanM family protein [Paenibacillus albidus]MBT2289865.1 type 2 lantipeptide synthetase LanM family protein [Paenibacillus albidus]